MTTMTTIRLTAQDLADVRAVTFIAIHEAAERLRMDGLLAQALGEIGGYLEVLPEIGTDFDHSVWMYEDMELSRERIDCLVRFALVDRDGLVAFLESEGKAITPQDDVRVIARERLALIERFLTLAGEVDRAVAR